jgi:hypothetical protein
MYQMPAIWTYPAILQQAICLRKMQREAETSCCTKPRDTPAKCVHCGGSHPANYKGCQHYRSLLNGYYPHRINHTPLAPIFPHEQTYTPSPINPQQPHHQQQQRTYASVVSNDAKTAEEQTSPLKSFIDEFKTLITQLINQNSMILAMLTTQINKH